jgi:spore coat protein U-like protein
MTFPRSGRWSAGRAEAVALAALCAWGMAAAAQAKTCTVSTGAVAFGVYEGGAPGHNEASGHVDVACTCSGGLDCADFSYTIELQAGGSGSAAARRMQRVSGTETLNYGLFQDSSRTVHWAGGADAVTRTYLTADFGSFQRTPVYGRIPAGQHVTPGSYVDTPGVVITY